MEPMSSQSKPRLAVVGVGDYYRMIGPGIREQFDTVLTVDKGDFDTAPGGLRSYVAAAAPDAVMILTPNRFHAEHIRELASLGLPTFVEKPLVTAAGDLEIVRETLSVNPALFCSDFYIDVWDAPLLKWLGLPVPACLDRCIEVTGHHPDVWSQGLQALGKIERVEGLLLEGVGPASSFKGREWLWDPVHGGVLWDMGYHTLAMWFRIVGTGLSVRKVERFTVADAPEGSSETLGTAELESEDGVPFRMQVGKYVPHDDVRTFTLYGTQGTICMDFVDPSRLIWNNDFERPLALLHGERLSHAAAVFREYVEQRPVEPFGFDVAERCVRTMLEIRGS